MPSGYYRVQIIVFKLLNESGILFVFNALEVVISTLVRLSKLMSERGLCSRREADRYIEQGLVLVDGEKVDTLGTKVSPDCTIELLERAQRQQEDKVTVLLNKPLGIVSTQPEKGYTPAIDLITADNQERADGDPKLHPRHLKKLAVAGRLDIDSKGLLVLTQDGVIVKQLIGPESNMEKEYLVGVEGNISEEMLKRLRFGLELDGKPLKRAKVKQIQANLLQIILKEGKKRQIRRMCELVGLKVRKLKRVRMGQVRLGDLPEGKWRFLQEHETF